MPPYRMLRAKFNLLICLWTKPAFLYAIQFVSEVLQYSKTCLKRPLKKK